MVMKQTSSLMSRTQDTSWSEPIWDIRLLLLLLMTESRAMGHYLDGSALELFLCIGATVAIFYWLGTLGFDCDHGRSL